MPGVACMIPSILSTFIALLCAPPRTPPTGDDIAGFV